MDTRSEAAKGRPRYLYWEDSALSPANELVQLRGRSANDTQKRRKIRWALPHGFAVCFTDDV